jgi:hypothetical protein
MIDTVPFMDVGPNIVGKRQFDSSLVGIKEGPPPNRLNSKPFIVKIQTGKEYGCYKPLFLKYAQQNIVLVVHFVPSKTPHSLAIWYRTGDENFISSVTLRSYNINFLYGS